MTVLGRWVVLLVDPSNVVHDFSVYAFSKQFAISKAYEKAEQQGHEKSESWSLRQATQVG